MNILKIETSVILKKNVLVLRLDPLSKLSLIVDSKGVPLSAHLDKGSISDQELLIKNLVSSNAATRKRRCICCLVYINPNNKSKRYMLADKIYDTKNVRNKIVDLNIKPIIASNKKNTKDREKLKKKQLTNHEKLIYKKRIIVENTFSQRPAVSLRLKQLARVGYLKIEDYLNDTIKMLAIIWVGGATRRADNFCIWVGVATRRVL